MRLSLVIPCYNESDSLPLLLERCKGLTNSPNIEIIIVNNGSTDTPPQILQHLLPKYPGCRCINVEENKGYGFGVLCGLKEAKGEILSWTHADMQADPQDVLFGLDQFDKYGNNIFVKGRRYGRPLMDVFFTVGMSVFETVLLGRPMWDINAQPTMFSRNLFESWTDIPNDFSLDLYAYYQARIYGCKVCRFPVKFGKRAYGTSHWNINYKEKLKFIRRTINFSLYLRKKL